MKNQKLRNPSIVIPTESRMKSFTDFDDKSVILNDGDFDNAQKLFNEASHIQKWMICRDRAGKRHQSQADNDFTKNSNCYMIQINDIFDVGYRRKISSMMREKQRLREKQKERNRSKDNKNHSNTNDGYFKKQGEDVSKVYAKIYCNLINMNNLNYLSRTIQFNLVQLESVKSALFKVSEPNLALFFHSRYSSQSQVKVRVELTIVESALVDNQQVAQNQQYLGYLDIDPFKGLKTKQKGQVYSQRLAVNLDTSIHYTVLVSDSFKVLEKLIPPNCLCSSDQTIAGLAGRRLPNNMVSLYYNIQYTDLHSLRMDIVCADVPDSLISAKLRECEKFVKHFENWQNPAAVLKQVRLQTMFHNGWTSFSESAIKLEDKMQIQRRQMKKSSKHQVVKQIIKFKQFTTNQICQLPFIFLDQQAILIMQLIGKVEVKNQQNIQTINVPICYAYYVIDKISIDDKQQRQLFVGDGLNAVNYQSIPKKYQINGKIQFYVHVQHANKMQLSKHLITVHTNKSHTEFDRVMLEKERMIRENKKLKNMNRVKNIELNQEIPILDTTAFKQTLYKDNIQRIRQERKEKQQLLDYLKNKVKQMCPPSYQNEIGDQQIDSYIESRKKFMNRQINQNYYNSVFYKAALEKNVNKQSLVEYNQDCIRVRPFSIFQQTGLSNLYQIGQVPLDIIKTELLQQNYCYAIFLNWISLIPVSEDKKLPRKFIFQTNFFKHPNISSCVCSVNQSTGQIEVVDENQQNPPDDQKQNGIKAKNQQKPKTRQRSIDQQKQGNQNKENKVKTKKIFYLEVGPDLKSKNNQNCFIQFISYLFHSELQIKLIDAISSIEFGECYFKLKDLIRMRRNEVSVGQQLWVKSSGISRAKLKVEIKVIRKQSTLNQKQKRQAISELQTLSMPQQTRQLQRIALYKQNRMGEQSSLNRVQKLLNEELTKQELSINVSRMKVELVNLEIINRRNHVQSYRIAINDPDKAFLTNDQLVVVNRTLLAKLEQTRWWKYLLAIQPGKYGNMGIVIPDDKNCFDLNPGQTSTILLYYYTQRKHEGDYHRDMKNKIHETAPSNSGYKNQEIKVEEKRLDKTQLLKMYNHSRCIDIILTNNSNNVLQSIYKINITSDPDYPVLNYKIVRKSNSKLLVQIPFTSAYNYVLYIDDPTVVSTLNQQEGTVALDCYAGNQGECRMFNVSILSPFPENRLLLSYYFQLWGAHQIYVQCGLWRNQQVLIDLHSSICQKKGLQYILALSEDQKTVNIREKNPIKVNQKQANTIIRANVTSSVIGIYHYQLSIVNPSDYSLIYRYTLKIQTEQPQICEKLTLRIRLTDKLLEEMFGFKNQQIRKQRYKILSTHPHILWATQDQIEVDAKTEKRIKIKINAEEILENELVILTMMTDTHSLNYLFVLQLDTEL